MAFKMKGFPKVGIPENKEKTYDKLQGDNINELDDKKSAILERANREGRDLTASEKAMVDRIKKMIKKIQ